MTLTLQRVEAPDLCEGSEWTVVDQDVLAEQIARIAVGQYRHVARILLGAGASAANVIQAAKKDAVALLSLKPEEKPWHRDGWVFQAISWIAAHSDGSVAIRAPHLIKAHKGFDGLKLEFSDTGAVTAVVVFEDKATDNPRDTIRDDVWPGIVRLEQGERSNELSQEVSALLETQLKSFPDLDVDAAVQEIAWKEARRYRVAITVDKSHANAKLRMALFKDFDSHAPGDTSRRLAETMHVSDLRPWMQAFANLVITKINGLPDNV
ncbi:hypothetical protein [Teichococcus aestuarii]|uniref:Uncharacterized protein n=1 Tax=Teichococcus aestuarii TaxID=568898 RepID=A0A2U1UXQ9_9PROT|nr:hypothetical protein [Pseudoroseomonas aestuarii]PWC26465.1 hypothetical protein CR165_23040 [Pseudoroseomonas aestuarii]